MKRRGKGKTIAIAIGVGAAVLLSIAGMSFKDGIRAWYLFVTRFERLAENPPGYTEYKHELTEVVFVYLPGGTFLMGSRQRRVRVSPFLIAKCGVAQGTARRKMDASGHIFPTEAEWQYARRVGTAERMMGASGRDFCRKTGLNFPTEAQWECARRAGIVGPDSGSGRLGWYGYPVAAAPFRVFSL